MELSKVHYIIVDRAEGRIEEVGRPEIFTSFQDASSTLLRWAYTAPKPGDGYHKADVVFVSDTGYGEPNEAKRIQVCLNKGVWIDLKRFFKNA